MKPTFSRLRGGLRIGEGFFARRGAIVSNDAPPRGLVDAVADLANPAVDVTRVHPAIARFLEDSGSLELRVESAWRFPFSLVWFVLRGFMRLVGQFVLPARRGRIRTRVLALDASRDGRADARAVIRTYVDSGEVMQVVAYATWTCAGARYMSAAFPMPGGQILGILRLESIAADDEGRLAVALSSRRLRDQAGVWFSIGPIASRAPLGEHLELWAAGMPGVPEELEAERAEDAVVVGRHVQTLFGVRFVTHRYWFRPLEGGAQPREELR